MPMPAIDAQTPERDHRSAGEHVKDSTKEFQQLQPVGQLHQESSLNDSANACGKGNKEEELEARTHLQGRDLTGIPERTTPSCEVQ